MTSKRDIETQRDSGTTSHFEHEYQLGRWQDWRQPVFKTILCVDGSAAKSSKRPVYQVRPGESGIKRLRGTGGVLAVLDSAARHELPHPLLITADVPIGLPAGFEGVYRGHGGFLPWVMSRERSDWDRLVVDSVTNQSDCSPFVVCKKGEKKLGGNFPLRRCEQITQGESLYWCVGGKQVGKAAIQFWRDVLVRLKRELGDEIAIWPFESVDGKAVVVAECYPATHYSAVWGRRVTKTNPLDVVDALDGLRKRRPTICDEKTWLHAASSEDDFDMFTTAVALADTNGEHGQMLAAPHYARPVEGWMLMLRAPDAPNDGCRTVAGIAAV